MSEENTDYKAMYESLRRLHDSTNEAVVALEKEAKKLLIEKAILLDKLCDCQKALDINKEIVRNALTRQNELANAYGDEVRALKEKLATLQPKE